MSILNHLMHMATTWFFFWILSKKIKLACALVNFQFSSKKQLTIFVFQDYRRFTNSKLCYYNLYENLFFFILCVTFQYVQSGGCHVFQMIEIWYNDFGKNSFGINYFKIYLCLTIKALTLCNVLRGPDFMVTVCLPLAIPANFRRNNTIIFIVQFFKDINMSRRPAQKEGARSTVKYHTFASDSKKIFHARGSRLDTN